jgi:glycosyltransferase involved in cell wall biosynthesis
MASGRAIIATAVGGVHEAIADTGLLVPPRDDRAMADACLQLLTDPERRTRLASAGRERVLSRFTLDLCLARYGEVYDALKDGVPVSSPDAVVPGGLGLPDLADSLEEVR